MPDPLGMLVILFIAMTVISLVGIILLYLLKSEKAKTVMLYILSVWGVIVAYCNVSGDPINWTGSIIRGWVLGALSVVAILIQLCTKWEKKALVTKLLVTVSVVAGMIDCFFF